MELTLRKQKIWALGALAMLAMANAPTDDFDTLVAAERRFAADAIALGITPAFRAHVAPDGMLISPVPRPAVPDLAEQTDTPGLRLEWQPEAGAIARSGDLGFTTGPYMMRHGDRVSHGQYFTIWRRDKNSGWRWVIDSGTSSGKGEVSMPSAVQRLGTHRAKAQSEDLAAVEGKLDTDVSALGGVLAADGRVLRSGQAPAIGEAGVALAAKGAKGVGTRMGGSQSGAGDLAYSYGRVAGPEGTLIGHYVRVWHRGPEGWRLLVDQFAPAPPKEAAKPKEPAKSTEPAQPASAG